MINQYALKLDKELTSSQLRDLSLVVTDERRKKSERYLYTKDIERCLVSEALLIYLLKEKYLMKNKDIIFSFSQYGKPFLKGSKLEFNISHSGDWIVCTIADNPVGVDVEIIQFLDFKSIYRTFSKEEILYFSDLDLAQTENLFFKLWTLKESFVKYNGKGLIYPFDSFSIDITNLSIFIDDSDIEDVSFYSKKLDDEHWYAICYHSNEELPEIQFLNLNEILDYYESC